MKGTVLSAMLLLAGAGLWGPATAQADPAGHPPLRKNSFSLNVGSLDEGDRDDTQYGAEYVRWLGHRFGVGVDIDYVDGDEIEREWAITVPFHLRFAQYFDLYAAPGLEFRNEAVTGDNDNDEYFFRIGLGAEFELGGSGWFVEPAVDADLYRDDEAYGLSLAIGKRF